MEPFVFITRQGKVRTARLWRKFADISLGQYNDRIGDWPALRASARSSSHQQRVVHTQTDRDQHVGILGYRNNVLFAGSPENAREGEEGGSNRFPGVPPLPRGDMGTVQRFTLYTRGHFGHRGALTVEESFAEL